MNLSAVILSGGESKRMGQDKAFVKLNGRSLLAVAVETVRRLGISDVFVSGQAGKDYSTVNCPVLIDLEPGGGPLGGIERGLHASSTALLLVLAMDLPFMSPAFLNKLIAQCNASTGVVPRLNRQIEPLAAIYPKRCHIIARGCIERSQRAVREFAEKCLEANTVRTMDVDVTDAGCFSNWNTPSDVRTSGET